MEVDPALNLSVGVLEIVGNPRNAGNRDAGSRVQVGVAAAGIDCTVADPKVRDACWIVSADRKLARDRRHVIADTLVPCKGDHRVEIANRGDRISDSPYPGCGESSYVSCQCSIYGRR